MFYSGIRTRDTFASLTLLHLYCCPRLEYALPLRGRTKLENLETLEIMWCGDLISVFDQESRPRHRAIMLNLFKLPKLKHIHLHELPKLYHIYGATVDAPKLETVKIAAGTSAACPLLQERRKGWSAIVRRNGGKGYSRSQRTARPSITSRSTRSTTRKPCSGAPSLG